MIGRLIEQQEIWLPKQEPAQISTVAFVRFSISRCISSALGFKPSGSWMHTRFAFSLFILSAILSISSA